MATPLHTVNKEAVIDEGIVSPPAPSVNQAAEGQKCTGKLTHQHVVAGWREGFSTTEQRPYFYNVYSRESVWALPCPATSPAGQAEKSGTPVDVLAAAVDELTRGSHPSPKEQQRARILMKCHRRAKVGPTARPVRQATRGTRDAARKGPIPPIQTRRKTSAKRPDSTSEVSVMLLSSFSGTTRTSISESTSTVRTRQSGSPGKRASILRLRSGIC